MKLKQQIRRELAEIMERDSQDIEHYTDSFLTLFKEFVLNIIIGENEEVKEQKGTTMEIAVGRCNIVREEQRKRLHENT